jgi:asparagine synthase (glutamine-hydrolysing)
VCGISGCIQQPDGESIVRVMNDCLAHRGPDAEGIHHRTVGDVDVVLAHRRLSIIDLSDAANQPFCKDGLALVYNGELYNFRAIRRRLEADGVVFRTTSDTEVVLEAWRRWGPSALSRFRGMFAFALYDEGTHRLVLARDQLGIKPLYLLRRGRGIVFASELKALLAALGPELTVDPTALVASMLYYWVPDQTSSIRQVEKLPPGSWAEVRPDGTVTVNRYWSIAEIAAASADGPSMDLGQVIEDSVEAHLVADVPISTFLSGGLDSSIVTVLAARSQPSVDAYTIRFRAEDNALEAMPDDAVYARKVAAQFGIDLHEIELAPDVVELLPRIVATLDEPIGDPAAINTVLICEAARSAGVKVLLSGMGADELFGGYRKHLACVLAARYRHLPCQLRKRVIEPSVDRLPVTAGGRGLRQVRWAKRFVTFADGDEEAAFRRSYTLYDDEELGDLISQEWRPHVALTLAQHREIYTDTTLDDHVNRMCLADCRLFLPGLNLAYTDRASMAASTEVRVPFVDVDVVRAAFSLPGTSKVAGRRGKVALKKAAEAWLPREIVHRPKASFGAPLRAWVRRDLSGLIDDVLVSGHLVRGGYLQSGPIRRLVEEDRSGREDRAKQLWQLLSMELWYRHVRDLGVSV